MKSHRAFLQRLKKIIKQFCIAVRNASQEMTTLFKRTFGSPQMRPKKLKIGQNFNILKDKFLST